MNIKSQIDAILAEDAGTTVPSGKGPKAQELIDPRTTICMPIAYLA